ncbi:hypothetical protein Tco_1060529 [Tanacetum coccineum]
MELKLNRDCSVANRIIVPNWLTVLRRCPRGGVESSQFEALQSVLKDVVLSNQHDSWKWSLDVLAGFSVASVRHLVDSRLLVVDQIATRWNRCVPIKVNVFLWRLSLNKLPSRMAKVLWDLLARWWESDIPVYANISKWYSWLDSLHASLKVRSFLEGVGGTLLWSIWNFRN